MNIVYKAPDGLKPSEAFLRFCQKHKISLITKNQINHCSDNLKSVRNVFFNSHVYIYFLRLIL
jgi:hypothetical protein